MSWIFITGIVSKIIYWLFPNCFPCPAWKVHFLVVKFFFVFVYSNKTKLWQEGYRPVSVSGCPVSVSASAILFATFSLKGGEQTARSHLTNQVKDTMYRSLKDFSIATCLSIPQGVPSENFTCVQAAEDWPCSSSSSEESNVRFVRKYDECCKGE